MTRPVLDKDDPHHAKLRKVATYASVSTATILIVAKLAGYLMTDSVSLMASLMDSTIDVFSSVIMMIGVHQAVQPADKEHRYGHGKFESLAALTQAIFIVGTAIFLSYESLSRFVTPREVQDTGVGIGIMALSIVLTLLLVTFQKYVIKRTGSVAIEADHLHYKGDLLVNLAVIVALVLNNYTPWPYFDPVFALAIAAFLLSGAWEIGSKSIDILMDRELSLEDRETIYNTVLSHPEIRGMHDLRTRTDGRSAFIELHAEMDGHLTLDRVHDISDEVHDRLEEVFPGSEVIIHQDPAGHEEDRLDDRMGDTDSPGAD